MPPSVIPPFSTKVTNKRQTSTINQLVSNQSMNLYNSSYKNETTMLLNQTNENPNFNNTNNIRTASFTINEN